MKFSKIRLLMAATILVGGVVVAHRVHLAREAEDARKRRLEKEQERKVA